MQFLNFEAKFWYRESFTSRSSKSSGNQFTFVGQIRVTFSARIQFGATNMFQE